MFFHRYKMKIQQDLTIIEKKDTISEKGDTSDFKKGHPELQMGT